MSPTRCNPYAYLPYTLSTAQVNGESWPQCAVPGNLKGDAFSRGSLAAVRRMGNQDAWAGPVGNALPQNGAKAVDVQRLAEMHPNQLHALEIDPLVVQNAHAGARDCGNKQGAIAKLLVVAGNVVSPEWGRPCLPGLASSSTLVLVPSNKSPAMKTAAGFCAASRRIILNEPEIAHVAEVGVTDQCDHPSAPRSGQIRQSNGYPRDPWGGRVNQAVQTEDQRQTKERDSERPPGYPRADGHRSTVENPARARAEEQKVENAEPHRRNGIENPRCKIGMPKGQKRRAHKTDGCDRQKNIRTPVIAGAGTSQKLIKVR